MKHHLSLGIKAVSYCTLLILEIIFKCLDWNNLSLVNNVFECIDKSSCRRLKYSNTSTRRSSCVGIHNGFT